ncbi:hypothetical protein VIGAN_10048300, partial [Vigna angularis var. angularis]
MDSRSHNSSSKGQDQQHSPMDLLSSAKNATQSAISNAAGNIANAVGDKVDDFLHLNDSTTAWNKSTTTT